jgi:3-(3-hydroxy-phenyl)propionate hydroxylase
VLDDYVRERGAHARAVIRPGFALLHTGPVEPGLLARARHLQARQIRLGDNGTIDDGMIDDGTLQAWLRHGRVTAVLLRPDRVVLATGR